MERPTHQKSTYQMAWEAQRLGQPRIVPTNLPSEQHEEWYRGHDAATTEDVVVGAIVAAPAPTAVKITAASALRSVSDERIRQITSEGFDIAHDDAHKDGEIARAAACYALPPGFRMATVLARLWPWARTWWKPGAISTRAGRRRDLVKAGALILAEIERLDRLEKASR